MPEAEERVERRLTAIPAADVAGYSRLIGIDIGEGRALSALNPFCRYTMEKK